MNILYNPIDYYIEFDSVKNHISSMLSLPSIKRNLNMFYLTEEKASLCSFDIPVVFVYSLEPIFEEASLLDILALLEVKK